MLLARAHDDAEAPRATATANRVFAFLRSSSDMSQNVAKCRKKRLRLRWPITRFSARVKAGRHTPTRGRKTVEFPGRSSLSLLDRERINPHPDRVGAVQFVAALPRRQCAVLPVYIIYSTSAILARSTHPKLATTPILDEKYNSLIF